jgi:predicted AlkP superfamily pyrophosphatase or phosphodiesterase
MISSPLLMLQRCCWLIVCVLWGFSGSVSAQDFSWIDSLPRVCINKTTVLLISFDGFRWDYMDKTPTPNLHRITAGGVRAEYTIPSFPSKTFPNHYSIVTGLHPEHHGIVANTMYDPQYKAMFRADDTKEVQNPRWWGGEPIWCTAEKQGQHAAVLFWPGSEVALGGVRPSFWRKYDISLSHALRVKQVADWLQMPDSTRPTLMCMYFHDADHAGHKHGPDSPEVLAAIVRLDSTVGNILRVLERCDSARNIHLIITSDHGMTPISTERLIFINDYLSPNDADIDDLSPVTAIRPRKGRMDAVYKKLLHAHPNMTVYRKKDIPERFHYQHNRRIPPIICIADDGWTITRRSWINNLAKIAQGGNHGFDNQLPNMRSFFVAQGNQLKQGFVAPPFANTNIYELLAHILRLKPAPNDGSLEAVRGMLR